jgi:undecaprenyl-diphosphatase
MKPGTLLMAAGAAALLMQRRHPLSMAVRVVLAVGVGLLIASGTGLVALPSIEQLVRDGTAGLGELTYVVVGGFALAESGAFVGLVAPGELVVVLGGVAAGHGTIALPTLIAIVWACALAGDLVGFTLGRRFGREVLLRHGGAAGITEARLARVEQFLQAHGAKTILVGRFIGVVRSLAPFVAGASRMPARRFAPVAVVASGLWAAAFCCLGYAFWESLDTLITLVERGSIALAVVAVGVVVVTQLRRRAEMRS